MYDGNAFLVKIDKDMKGSRFNYIGGDHLGSAFSFLLLNGNHSLKEIRITDNKAVDKLIQVGSTVYIENIYVE